LSAEESAAKIKAAVDAFQKERQAFDAANKGADFESLVAIATVNWLVDTQGFKRSSGAGNKDRAIDESMLNVTTIPVDGALVVQVVGQAVWG
jgi:hypothetical protein